MFSYPFKPIYILTPLPDSIAKEKLNSEHKDYWKIKEENNKIVFADSRYLLWQAGPYVEVVKYKELPNGTIYQIKHKLALLRKISGSTFIIFFLYGALQQNSYPTSYQPLLGIALSFAVLILLYIPHFIRVKKDILYMETLLQASRVPSKLL